MSHGLPPNPMRGPPAGSSMSPPRRDFRDGPGPGPDGRSPLRPDYPPPPRDDDRGRGGWGRGREDFDDRWNDRGGWAQERDRRPPPPRWEDEYDRPKRRRSPSPFGPSHRQRLHSPSPPPISRLQFPDPAELPHSLTYRQFADWFRASHPQTAKQDEEEQRRYKQGLDEGKAVTKERVGMAKRYERYRKEYTSRQLYGLFLTHRDSPWFQERYATSPDYVALRRRVNRQGRVPTVQRYIDELRAGEHDQASFELPDAKDRNGSSSKDAQPEGLDRALGDAPVDTDPLRVEVPPSQRQVFVKTVPPGTGRKALEGMFKRVPGFQYLALTEPAVKKAFHRVGWAQYAEGVDVKDVVTKLDNSKVDNFTFHLGVNATPVVGRIRLTAPLANTLDRLLADGERAKQMAEKLEEELLGDDEDEAGEAAAESTNGESASPVKSKKEVAVPGLSERGSKFVQEKIDQLCEDAGLTGDLDIEQQTRKAKIALDQWLGYLRFGLSTCYYCVASQAFPEELHRKCISHMRPHPSTISESAEQVENQDERDARMDEERVDGAEEENRRDDGERKADRSAGGENEHKGGRVPNHLKSEDERWAEGLDLKLRATLDADVNVTEYGGRDLDEESLKICQPAIKQEEASKYRCTHCSKLFKAPEFVVKHIASKHPEELKPKLDKFIVFNNYILDPQRLQPGPTNAAAVNDELPLPPQMGDFTAFGVPIPIPIPSATTVPGQPFDERMMQQQMMMMMSMQQMMMANMGGGMANMPGLGGMGGMGGMGMGMGGQGGQGKRARAVGVDVDGQAGGVPPGGEDPRARKGRMSYQDLDSPGGAGDGGLPY